MAARRRRSLILALTVVAFVISFVQPGQARKHQADPAPRTVTFVSPSPNPVAKIKSVSHPQPKVSPSVRPSPTPLGPPFVLDAASSCAGSTALVELQVAATDARPIVKLELLLDGAPAEMTPVPGYPLQSFAGRSSGGAAPSGAGQWVIRATDAQGIAEAQPFPYACG